MLATTTLGSAMSISVEVHLLSGKKASLEVDTGESVEFLERCARSALSASKGRLLNSSGQVLDGASSRIASLRLLNKHEHFEP